ncbi:hypothetical protein BGX21_004887 [Mortierella sp. AD011]|nr:hypothetical protein BGX20_005050 [Mortierella sp. AD010]KAF9400148.1 hypothetical protein BGX21_004887 [Mortierella sp. AD011]
MAGNFTSSCRNMKLIDGHILYAECRDFQGEWFQSTLDLDEHLGNDNGVFRWYDKNFSHSAEDVRLVDGGTIAAKLRRWSDQQWESSSVSLNNMITNNDGRLEFSEF